MSLSESLQNIIAETTAPPHVTAFLLKEGLYTCALVFDAVSDVTDVEGKIAASLDPPVTSLRDIASLKNMWRRAAEKGKEELVTSKCNDVPEDWEVALPQATQTALLAKFLTKTGLVLRGYKMPCDPLLGRIFREKERKTLTIFPLSRVRSVCSQPQSRERHSVGGGLTYEKAAEDNPDITNHIFGFFLSLTVLCNTYAIVGTDGWCSWQAVQDYLDLVEQKLWHPRGCNFKHVKEVELEHRERWADMVRENTSMTLTAVIAATTAELHGLWKVGSFKPSELAKAVSPGQGNHTNKAKTFPDSNDFVKEHEGKEICLRYQLGKCREPCFRDFVHICNQKGCGKRHPREANHRGQKRKH